MAVKVVHRFLKATSELMCVTPAGKIGNCTCGMSKLLPHLGKKLPSFPPLLQQKCLISLPRPYLFAAGGIWSFDLISVRKVRFFRSSVRISPLPRQIRRSEKFMNTIALQFDKLVEPYYPTLGHFAAGVCGNPLIASVLAPGFFTKPKTASEI